MDPAKRICLKNLPPDVTKADIADIIKKRTRAQPRYIDLGTLDDGTPRRFAHVSVEGLKSVLEAINGVGLRGFNIIAEQAKPHYSFALAEAKRKREREEEQEEESRRQRAQELLEKWAAQPETITKEKPPRPFYGGKQKYSRVASEIAAKCREAAKARKASSSGYGFPTRSNRYTAEPGTATSEPVQSSSNQQTSAAPESTAKPLDRRGPRKNVRREAVAAPVAPPQPPPPPQPTKEERKLTGLQAKLAALREKMKQTSVAAAAPPTTVE